MKSGYEKKVLQIRDPIHGMIELNAGEVAIINHEVFQRLRNIRQLALTNMVYPGAMHSRFEHSLGVMHLAGRVMDSLRKRSVIKDNFTDDEFNRYKQLVRLAGLLHDVGHAPFSHGGEELFRSGLKHETYSNTIIRCYFSHIIEEYFPNIKVEEITTLLSKGYLRSELVFLGKIIDGEMDTDKLDYLLRDSYYCGVHYGKYDLERILDTITVVPVIEREFQEKREGGSSKPKGFWLLGIDSDGIQAVEELIFARYWMFIQVYFHKTRRIYDFYLTSFLREFLKNEYGNSYFPLPERIENYISLDDSICLEAMKRLRNSSEWARRIIERDHLSEAFVSLPHHTGSKSYLIFSELQRKFNEKYGSDPASAYVDNKAKKLSTNPFFDLKKQEEGDERGEGIRFENIMVQDKHDPSRCNSVFELSFPLKHLARRNINIIRFYVARDKKTEAAKWCAEQFDQIRTKVNKIEEGWL